MRLAHGWLAAVVVGGQLGFATAAWGQTGGTESPPPLFQPAPPPADTDLAPAPDSDRPAPVPADAPAPDKPQESPGSAPTDAPATPPPSMAPAGAGTAHEPPLPVEPEEPAPPSPVEGLYRKSGEDLEATDGDPGAYPESSQAALAQAQEPPVQCLLGAICVGPVGSLGLLNPLGLGLHARLGDYVGAAIDYQFIPSFTTGDFQASWSLVSIEARVHPFGGGLFLAGGVAIQSFSARGAVEAPDPELNGDTETVNIDGSLSIPTLKLGVGVIGRSGFVVGIDIGFEFPLGDKQLTFDTRGGLADLEAVQQLEDDMENAADAVVDLIPLLIQVNLLRIGYLF